MGVGLVGWQHVRPVEWTQLSAASHKIGYHRRQHVGYGKIGVIVGDHIVQQLGLVLFILSAVVGQGAENVVLRIAHEIAGQGHGAAVLYDVGAIGHQVA